jgi:hypothetical protein
MPADPRVRATRLASAHHHRARRPAERVRWLRRQRRGQQQPPPSPGTQNPCTTPSLEAEVARPTDPAAIARKAEIIHGDPRTGLPRSALTHRERATRPAARVQPLTEGRDTVDIGEIAVIQDEGDIIASPNVYDLRNLGLRFTETARAATTCGASMGRSETLPATASR